MNFNQFLRQSNDVENFSIINIYDRAMRLNPYHRQQSISLRQCNIIFQFSDTKRRGRIRCKRGQWTYPRMDERMLNPHRSFSLLFLGSALDILSWVWVLSWDILNQALLWSTVLSSGCVGKEVKVVDNLEELWKFCKPSLLFTSSTIEVDPGTELHLEAESW